MAWPRPPVAALLLGACLLLGGVAPASAQAAKHSEKHTGRDAGSDSTLAFRLADQFGQVYDAAAYRGRALILVGAGRGGRAVGTEWVIALRGMQEDSLGGSGVPVIAVADLRGLPRLLRRFVRGQFPDDRRQPVLLDWTGSVARQLAFDPARCTIVVVGPDGQASTRLTPDAMDGAGARGLLRQARGLTTARAAARAAARATATAPTPGS